jgi:hypothetical protein
MKDFKKLREEALRQQQRHDEVFKEGDHIMSARTGIKGSIHRVGGNYAIIISEDGEMFREWVKDIRLLNLTENINKERKSSILKNGKAETNN